MINKVNEIHSKMAHLNVPAPERKAVLSAAVITVVAYSAQLPTSPVTNLHEYYSESIKPTVIDEVSKLNQHLVVDVPDVMEGVWAVWKGRYRSVHDGLSSEAMYSVVHGSIYNDCKVISEAALNNRGAITKVAQLIAGEM